MHPSVKAIDLMMGIPSNEDRKDWYEFMKPLLMDEESRTMMQMPAQFLFKDIPETGPHEDFIAYVTDQMDAHGVDRAMVGYDEKSSVLQTAWKDHQHRFFFDLPVNANLGMDEVRRIKRLHKEVGIKAVSAFPSGISPQVPINDKKWYPIYAACVELDIPFCCCVGVPGPRLPMEAQRVDLIDEVCWFFPELKFVMRHGAEPWEDMAVKLMLKYPNLYYSTSAFAPKHYPQAIIDYANKRGADKVMYAGYFPMGLSLERIATDMPTVPFKEDVWPKFLRENAIRVFNL